MPKSHDLTGMKVGELTVLCRDVEKTKACNGRRQYWFCKCSCGTVKSYIAENLTRKHTTSCGCKTNNYKHKTHGKSSTRLYKIWVGMRKRCYNPSTPHFEYYGGRGITVCEEWNENFESFYNWSITNGYADSLSIDRIDNDKGYSPDNCRWSSKDVQARNKTNLIKVNVNGTEKTLCDWSAESGLPLNVLRLRYLRGIQNGISIFDDSFFEKIRNEPRKVNQYSMQGKLIAKWDSAKLASINGDYSAIGIRECCNGNQMTHKGYIWKYAD